MATQPSLSSTTTSIPPHNHLPRLEDVYQQPLGFGTALGQIPNIYAHTDPLRSAPASRMHPISRNNSTNPNNAVNLDPIPGDPDVVFIRAPFNEFPGAQEHKNGLTYNLLAAHPNWFLDINDFSGSDAIVYPSQLEPPRGWCPTKKKEAKDGWKEGEEPRLRCTLCRRQYAGVNAKSMWRRHVYEKHKIAMANRRENNERPSGRGARSSNKENKGSAKPAEKDQSARNTTKAVRRVVSLEVQASNSSTAQDGHSLPLKNTSVSNNAEDSTLAQALGEDDLPFVEGPSFSSTPPRTPRSPSVPRATLAGGSVDDSVQIVIPPESPYNPLMTPAFRHSPAQLPHKQPWKLAPNNDQKVRNYTLAMLARGEASPTVRGLDVSPIVLVPASERQKRSIFSPPRAKSVLSMSPRRLFADTGEDVSIQSRLDQPGWDVPLTPSIEDRRVHDYSVDELVRQMEDAAVPDARAPPPEYASTPRRLVNHKDEIDYLSWPHDHDDPAYNFFSTQYTPHTRMFINGIVSPLKGPDSSPCPIQSPAPSSGRSRRGSLSQSPRMASLSPGSLLPPFSELQTEAQLPAHRPVDVFEGLLESSMDIDVVPSGVRELSTPVKIREPLSTWRDLFNPGAAALPRADYDSNDLSISLSSSTSSLPSLSTSRSTHSLSSSTSYSWRASSPSHSNERNRARSGSNAGASMSSTVSGSSGGHKHSVGLMDAVLGNKLSRRKQGLSDHRGDGDTGVTAMGSPFKMGRKTSRREFLYSLDGDCEMQDAQPRKRRKTVSGRD